VKKICVVVGSRANYSSIKSVMQAVKDHPDLELQLVVGASAILDKYGAVVDLIIEDGFNPLARVNILLAGDTPESMAKSAGLGIIELSTIFEQIKPDVVITVGDRFETMSTTIAAAYMNIVLGHTMGGEVTGTIDESIRHAVTKFAHIHFAATKGARNRIIRMGEEVENVHWTGCPRIDLVAEILSNETLAPALFEGTPGDSIDLSKPFIIMSQHPVTTEYGEGEKQVVETLHAIRDSKVQAVVLWPNSDAGSDDVSRAIRKFREDGFAERMHFVKNMPIKDYVLLMDKAACLVGNSSSGIREGAFIGVPVVNIGSRQSGRETSQNVLHCKCSRRDILDAILYSFEQGKYPSDHLYGDGTAGRRIADILAVTNIKTTQKRITY